MKKSDIILTGATIQLLLFAAGAAHAESLRSWESLSDTLSIEEAVISTSFGRQRRSPLRLSTVEGDKLYLKAASGTYPQIVGAVPGVYAVSETGSHGDARLNIRGFAQENISVLLNGIPISGLTSGNMYWNNWMGLSDATQAIQVQKGIGTSMLADGSVGGSVNIITTIPRRDPSLVFGANASDYGTFKEFVNFRSGELPHGWNVLLNLSYVHGSGYVDCTYISALSYLFSLSKSIGEHNSLYFTALGSPERHGQRSSRLSYDEVLQHGRTYNKNWGMREGQAFNLSENHYYKPYFTLQHFYRHDKLSLTNSLYLALASGGGRWNESKGAPVSSIMTPDGQVDWDTVLSAAGDSAPYILSDYLAGHTQAGAIVSGEYRLPAGIKLSAGAHWQYYGTWENERITDLLGSGCWEEKGERKRVGDLIRTDNGKTTNTGTLYMGGFYDRGRFSATLGMSLFGSVTTRWDRYNYTVADIYSQAAWAWGANFKGGLLYRADASNCFYLNAGAYSRLPYPSVFFASGDNTLTRGVKNEKDYMAELGWRFTHERGWLEIGGYAVRRKDKSLMSNVYKQSEMESQRYMISGLGARHLGVEAEALLHIAGWLEVRTAASVGDWRWTGNIDATIYDRYTGLEIQTVKTYCDGLPVGDAPQTRVSAGAGVSLFPGFRVLFDWTFSDRMYASFDPSTRTMPDAPTAYRIPAYHLLDATLEWSGSLPGGFRATAFVTCNNISNTLYIENGRDGASHDLAGFRGYWSFGRTFTFGLRFSR